MPRYNTSLATSQINGSSTISSPFQGAFTQLTGTAPYTVTLPNPALFPGSNQTFYNATSGTITLSTPSGTFTGTGGSGSGSLSCFTGNVVSVTSDGTNYIVISEDGSPLIATTGTFSSDVSISGTLTVQPSGTVSISPSVAGTINNVSIGATTRSSGAFTTLAANAQVSFTGNISSSSTTSGTVVVTGGLGVSGAINATSVSGSLTGTLQTASQPNITTIGTLGSLTVTNTVNNRYLHYQVPVEGAGNLGTHQGYLLLAKAYVSGLQPISYVKGYFTLTRGGPSSGNKSDIFYVNSQSAYNGESFLVTGSTNGGFWSRTVKVTYGGTVYHAIETGNGGGEPDNGVYFTGEVANMTFKFTDATFVTNVTAFGNSNITNANDGTTWNNGNLIVGGVTQVGNTALTVRRAGVGSVSTADSNTNAHINLVGTDSLVRLQLGTMNASPYAGWIQASYDNTGGANGIEPLQLNPNGGNIGINMGLTTTPATRLNINHGPGSAAGDAVIRIGGTNNYASLELGIKGSYDGMIRTYGNDLHIYSGHWQSASTATENHSIFFYTSQNGSTNWSTPKMTLNQSGNLTVTGTITESSSITLKENIEPITGALNSILQLSGKIYDRIDNNEKREAGLIAEDVYKVLPNLVHVDENGKPMGVKYTKTVAYLVESIKELYEEIKKLKG